MENIITKPKINLNQNVISSMTADINQFVENNANGAKNIVVFYKLVIGFSKNNKQWALMKRYSDFDGLDKVLRPLYSNLPSLPGKTFFKLSQ